jgi:alpha-1,2-rhamnosyltransferase
MAEIRRVLLECTHTYESALNTGIQRVVRNILRESKTVCRELDIECQPVIIKLNRLWAVEKIERYTLHAQIISFLRDVYRNIHPLLCNTILSRGIEKLLRVFHIRLRLINVANAALGILLLPAMVTLFLKGKVTPREGDLLLLIDSSWVYSIWHAVKGVKSKNVKVGLVVHDIFQVTQPHLFPPAVVERFLIWIDQAIKNVDFFIGVSQTTRDEVKGYVKSKFPSVESVVQFESFQLGAVIDNVGRKGRIRPELKKIFEGYNKHNTYLTVGTIEPRKNHKYLLDAFDEIWRQCPDVNLCIVGRISWFFDGIEKRIKQHIRYNKSLLMYHNLSDTELDYCYRHSKALVYPSIAEGFGLPLVEALYKGLPVLASDIPVFREVGKDFCTYFDINQPRCLAKLIIGIESQGKMPQVRNIGEYQLPDWNDSCRELLSKAVALSVKIPAHDFDA